MTTGREQSRVRMLRTKKSSRVDRADITGESRSNRWRTGVFSFLRGFQLALVDQQEDDVDDQG